MLPILLEIGGIKVHAYGFFIAFGYITALGTAFLLAHWRGRDPAPYMDLAFIGIMTGVIGARLFFIASNLDYYRHFPVEILYVWNGGLVFYGGFLFALPFTLAYIHWKKLNLWETLDFYAPSVSFAHALGRIGCLCAGCCHGSASSVPWAVRFNTELVEPSLRNIPVHPTQAYEAFSLAVLGFVTLYLLKKNRFKHGVTGLIYLMTYAVSRGLIEIFRGDDTRGFLPGVGLSTSQTIAIVLFLGGAFFLWRRLRTNN